jgi:hypothetical protein
VENPLIMREKPLHNHQKTTVSMLRLRSFSLQIIKLQDTEHIKYSVQQELTSKSKYIGMCILMSIYQLHKNQRYKSKRISWKIQEVEI